MSNDEKTFNTILFAGTGYDGKLQRSSAARGSTLLRFSMTDSALIASDGGFRLEILAPQPFDDGGFHPSGSGGVFIRSSVGGALSLGAASLVTEYPNYSSPSLPVRL
ncbi:MAG: hypothetical protein WCT14_06270 [Treponemataceae bacterium]